MPSPMISRATPAVPALPPDQGYDRYIYYYIDTGQLRVVRQGALLTHWLREAYTYAVINNSQVKKKRKKVNNANLPGIEPWSST